MSNRGRPGTPAPYPGKIYVGLIGDEALRVEVYKGTTALGELRKPVELWTGVDCPDKFFWGFGGDRDTFLALALLADVFVTEPTRALRLFRRFRARVIDRLPVLKPFCMTHCEIFAQVCVIEDMIDREGQAYDP